MAQTLLQASQTKINEWLHNIDIAISQKPDIERYNEKKQLLMPKLLEARAKGVTLRELSTIMGIPHQTIAKWLKQSELNGKDAELAKAFKERREAKATLPEASDYIKQAKALKESTEQTQHA